MKTYEVRYNRSRYQADSIEEAISIAKGLVDQAMPFDAKVIEFIDGVYSETILRYFPN